ncbi:MAG: hypothetical protein OEL76_00805 [Siculibacillus sp.]|nr:hypothetical protein [Siculibacillus sp.]
MRPRRLVIGTAVLVLLAAAEGRGVAAEPCTTARAANNPAFGAPRACAPAPRETAAAPRAKAGPAKRATAGEGSVFRPFDGTTVTVGGSVTADTVVGRGAPPPLNGHRRRAGNGPDRPFAGGEARAGT